MKKRPIDQEVDRLIGLMSQLDPSHKDYRKAAESLKTICEARSKKSSFPVDPEMLIAAGINLLGIVLILNHEHLNVITSKATMLIRK